MIIYAKLLSETSIDRNPPRSAIIDGRFVTGELPEAYLNSQNWFRLTETPMPDNPQEGYHVERRYAYDDAGAPTAIVESWVEVQDPPAPPRSLSRKKLRDAFVELGVWNAVRDYLQTSDKWEIFLLSTTLDEDNELVQEAIGALRETFGLSQEQIESILSASVAE